LYRTIALIGISADLPIARNAATKRMYLIAGRSSFAICRLTN
jgi:hypothetical protein